VFQDFFPVQPGCEALEEWDCWGSLPCWAQVPFEGHCQMLVERASSRVVETNPVRKGRGILRIPTTTCNPVVSIEDVESIQFT